jgi:putative restriction endonuclease
LRHGRLLDAAHITPDSASDSSTSVTNGLALCKIHHAAYDVNIIGINSDYVVKVREDVLHEIDGPMLKHGLVEMDGVQIWTPNKDDQKPDKERLANRFSEFSGI